MSDASARLRVLVITEDDPLYVVRFFEVFFAELPRDRIDLVGITISKAFHEPLLKTASRIRRFYGTLDFVRLLGRYAKAKLAGAGIGALAERAAVPFVPADSVNAETYLARVRALDPDIIVSVAAPEIFRKPLLSLPRFGCINIHSGRLPRYRGMMPTFWQLKEGERHATVTIHEMAEKLDAGDIIATYDFPLEERDRLDRVITGTKREGARLMIRVLAGIRDSRPPTTPLDMREASYFRFPKPEDVREFRARGHRML